MSGLKYAGADWIKSALKVTDMSSLGERAANVLGAASRGIYHLDDVDLKAVDWSDDHHIEYRLRYQDVATVDGNFLTVLVVLCHDSMMRLSIRPRGHHSLALMFHDRKSRDRGDGFSGWCPTLEDHARMIRVGTGFDA